MCEKPVDPYTTPYCSRTCSRLNALVTPPRPMPAVTPPPDRGPARRARHAARPSPEPSTPRTCEPPTPRTCVPCRACQRPVMVIMAGSGVLRVDPEPAANGSLVVNGQRLIAILPQKSRPAWSGHAYREHKC